MTFTLQPISPTDAEWVRAFMIQHWGDENIVVHGQVFSPHTHPGFIARAEDEFAGLITYRIAGDSCEILTLNSLLPGQGVGSALIEAVRQAARKAGCRCLWLITTNDNLNAIGFYQRHGFHIAAVYPGAVNRARLIKPVIPLIGENGIPIRDEIEFEEYLL